MARSSRHLASPSPLPPLAPAAPPPRARQRLWPQMIPLPPPPNRSPAQSGGRTHQRGELGRGQYPHQGRGARSAYSRRLCPYSQTIIEKKPTLTPKPATRPLWDQDCLVASPLLRFGKGGTLLRAQPSLGCRPALQMNQTLPSIIQTPAHSSLEGPRMEEKTQSGFWKFMN